MQCLLSYKRHFVVNKVQYAKNVRNLPFIRIGTFDQTELFPYFRTTYESSPENIFTTCVGNPFVDLQ